MVTNTIKAAMSNAQGYINGNPLLKRLYRNAAIVFHGNIISSAIGLLTLIIITRTLSIEAFGYYALTTSFISLLDRLTSFQTWQALIHFGAKAREKDDKPLLMSLFAFCFCLDTTTGILGFIIAIFAAIYVPGWFGLNGASGVDPIMLTAIAATVLLFNWTSTPTAVLRLYDKFYAQALYQKVTALCIFLGSLFLWATDTNSLEPYIFVWAMGTIIGRILFLYMAVRLAKIEKVWSLPDINMRRLFEKTDKLWHHVITTNLDGVVRVLRDLDIFFVNAVLGASAAGLYKVARKMAQLSGKVTGPFYQAIYPELATLYSEGKMDEFLKLMRQSSLTLGLLVSGFFVGFLATGWFLLPWIFGPEYAQAYSISAFCIGSMVIWAFAQPLSPAMMAMGKVQWIFIIHLITTIIYSLTLFALMYSIGILGAGIALFIFYGIWALSMHIAFRKIVAYNPRDIS